MSSLNLNLLPSKARFQAAKIRLKKKIKLGIIVIVSLWLASMILVLVLNVWVKFRNDAANSEYKKAQSEYLALSDNIVINQKLKFKAKLVGGVLNQRFEYGKAFETIKSLFPTGIDMKTFELKDKGRFLITGETTGKGNVDSLEKLVDSINGGQNDKFSKAALTGIVKKESNWSFSLEVNMK